MGRLRQADWKVWLTIPVLPVWQAVALSLNLDPRSRTREEWTSLKRPIDYGDRLLVAKNNIGRAAGLEPAGKVRQFPQSSEQEVELVGFAYWARSMRYPLPPQLGALADQYASPAKASADAIQAAPATITARERNTLLRIIRVLADMNNLPLNKPRKAAGMIQKHAELRAIDLGERTIAEKLKEARDLVR